MSDEMVLESTETAPTSPNEDGRLDHSGEPVPAAPATTEEPAPAQPAAPANETPAPSVAEELTTQEEDEERYSMAAFGQLQQLQRDTVVDGMVYVPSGYGSFGGGPGNVLLAYGVANESAK